MDVLRRKQYVCPYNEGVECQETAWSNPPCAGCAWNTEGHTAERRLYKIKSRLRSGTPETATRDG